MDSHIPYGNHGMSQNSYFGLYELTNINDNLSNYIFQASVKLSLVVSSVKVGSCQTLEQERFCWERGSCMVWEINMGVCPRLDFENIMLFNCLGYNFNIYDAFEFLCNSNC